ncbi:MAG TPA: 3-hydroxyacyl-CoA dehydrogenase NAD-binding domain-containing protein [Chloroflexia bacterium]|nr:3-hydroxyacyl-CoA dehydrogenase NAD-binding domain-containing protein [Chloroflexia bacterium]
MPHNIAVIGAGTMGAGIVQLAAQSGCDVLMYDIKDEFVQRGLTNIQAALQSRVDKGKMGKDEMKAILGHITTGTNRDDAANYDLIIEAAPESMELKREIFADLGRKASPTTILATNTSSLSITSIASASPHPERVVGMHFFNPAPVMPLVEVIAAAQTSGDTVESVRTMAQAMGKSPVRASDTPGFIVNRVARPFYSEALKIVGDGSARISTVDEAMRAAGFRMGPFELMDFIGIDVNFAVTQSVYDAFFGEPRYRPNPIQQRMVEAGTLGRKTGRGFYRYMDGKQGDSALVQDISLEHKRNVPFIPEHLTQVFLSRGGIQIPEDRPELGEIIVRILVMIMNEAAFAVGEGVASVRDIDIAMKLGTNYPKGPLKWADEIGLDTVHSVLKSLIASLADQRYRPAPLLWQMLRSGATGDAVGEGFHTPGEKGMV